MPTTKQRDAENPQGPTWWEAFEEVARVERERQLRIRVQLTPGSGSGRWRQQSGSVGVIAEQAGVPTKFVHQSSASFRGRSGFKTFPSALVWALHELENWLDEREAEPPLLAAIAAAAS